MINKEQKNFLKVKNVAATMAIEGMYFKKDFIKNMVKVANGEISSEDMRRAVIKKYGK